jgi:hypothetical protein
MTNKFTLNYTIWGGTLEKPRHLKYEFEDDGDLLGALDTGGCAVLDSARAQHGDVEIILRSITHDNAQEFYKAIVDQEKNNVQAS